MLCKPQKAPKASRVYNIMPRDYKSVPGGVCGGRIILHAAAVWAVPGPCSGRKAADRAGRTRPAGRSKKVVGYGARSPAANPGE